MPVQPWVIKTLAVLALLGAAAFGGYKYADYKWQSRVHADQRDAQSDARETEAAGNAMAARIEANTIALISQIEADRARAEQLVAEYGAEHEQNKRDPARACPAEGDRAGEGSGTESDVGEDSGRSTARPGYWLTPGWVRAFNATLGAETAAAPAEGHGAGGLFPADWALRACSHNNTTGREARAKLRKAQAYIRGLCDKYGCQGDPFGGGQ